MAESIHTQYVARWGSEGLDAEAFRRGATQVARRLGPWLPRRGAHCLDLACGHGELVAALLDAGADRLVGVDLRPQALDVGRAFVPRAEWIEGDVLEFVRAAPSSSFDFISAMNLLEHLPQDTLPGLLAEVRRVLRPGGAFVAMVPNAMSPFGASTRYWDITHVTAFTPASVRQLASICGWHEPADFRECAPIPHGVPSTLRWLAWRGLRAGIQSWFLVETGGTRGTHVYTMDMLFKLSRA